VNGGSQLGAVQHQAYISVDENGTVATAATGITGVTAVSQSPTVVLDSPFVYLIYDRTTDALLFLGRVADPAQG
jgi:serpin B